MSKEGFPNGAGSKDPTNAGDARDSGLIPGSEDPLEEGMESHSSILAWRTPWTEDRGGLQFMGLQSLTQLKWPSTCTQAMQETPAQFLGWEAPCWRKYQPTPVFSPGESPWTEEPGLWGLQRESYSQSYSPWGHKESDMTELQSARWLKMSSFFSLICYLLTFIGEMSHQIFCSIFNLLITF